MKASGEQVVFEVDESAYPLESVQAAAYAYTDRAYALIERGGAEKIRVRLDLKEGTDARALRGEFENEMLHQVLRHRVSAANQKIREFIVTKALVCAQPAESVAAAQPAAAAETACAECAPAPKVDEALEKEIDRLLAEIEGDGAGGDPLGVAVPWEEKFGKEAAGAEPAAPVKPKPKAVAKKSGTRAA